MHPEYDHLFESAGVDPAPEPEPRFDDRGFPIDATPQQLAAIERGADAWAARVDDGADRPRLMPEYKPGDRVLIEVRTRHLTTKHIVTIRSIEQRGGFRYVGWVNQPWDRDNGHWGYFRDYPTPQPFGTRVLEVIR